MELREMEQKKNIFETKSIDKKSHDDMFTSVFNNFLVNEINCSYIEEVTVTEASQLLQ